MESFFNAISKVGVRGSATTQAEVSFGVERIMRASGLKKGGITQIWDILDLLGFFSFLLWLVFYMCVSIIVMVFRAIVWAYRAITKKKDVVDTISDAEAEEFAEMVRIHSTDEADLDTINYEE